MTTDDQDQFEAARPLDWQRAVLRDPAVTRARAVAVAAALVTIAPGKAGDFYASVRAIQRLSRGSERTVKAAMSELVDAGYLHQVKRGRGATRQASTWRLLLPERAAEPADSAPSDAQPSPPNLHLADQAKVRNPAALGATLEPARCSHGSTKSPHTKSLHHQEPDGDAADDDAGIVEAARRVAAVAVTVGRPWDATGIVPALRALVAQGATVDQAEAQAVRAASNPEVRTPAAIAWERFKATPPAATEPSGPTCRVCGLTSTGHDRNRDNTGDPHGWEPVGGEPTESAAPDLASEREPAEPADQPFATLSADSPAQPDTDTPPGTADPAEPHQRPYPTGYERAQAGWDAVA